MEIESLRFVVRESDLNELAAAFLPQTANLCDLRISVVPEGIRVSGTYETIVRVRFETLWQVSVSEGKVVAMLQKLETGILSLGLVKGYLLRTIARAMDMLELRADKLLLDVDLLLRERGVQLRTNLTRIRCDDGILTIESGEAG